MPAGELVCETVARRCETAHVADSQRSSDSLFKNKRSRRIAKGDGLGLHLVCELGKLSTLVSFCAGPENTVMRNPIDIESSHSRAIAREIGERLRPSFKEDREIPASFRMQIERLRQLEERGPRDLGRVTADA